MNNLGKQKIEIVKNYIYAYNHFDVKGMLKNLSSDIVFKNSTNEEIDLITNGIEEFKAQAEKATSFFSHREQKIINTKQEGNVLTIDIDYQGTLKVNFPNGLRKGEIIHLKGKSVFTFREHQIIEINDIS